MHTIQTDSKGRLTLGSAFASCYFIIEQPTEGEFTLKKAVVVPEQELWLYKNKKALASVQKGIKEAKETFRDLQAQAEAIGDKRKIKKKSKSSRQEGLFKQIVKTLKLLRENPRYPGLHTHPYTELEHPWFEKEKVFEAYIQNNTPGAYRVF